MSLELPAGATAQSPYTCVNVSYPLFRFFARNYGANSNVRSPSSTTTSCSASSRSTSGQSRPPQLGTARSSRPPRYSDLTSLGDAQVSLRFTAVGGPAQIDDVYIDPRCMD